MFGSRISTVAFPMFVLRLNNSPFITGLVAFAVIAPSILFFVPAGVLVDRWNPRRVMLVSEFLRGLIIASVVAAIFLFGNHVSIRFLIPAMVLEEIFEIFFTLADRRYLSRLMERDKIRYRQGYVEVRAHAVILAGRPLGPFLFTIEPVLPFACDALSFVFSIASLVWLRKGDDQTRLTPRVSLGRMTGDLRQGFTWLKRDRRATLTLFLMAGTSLVAQALILVFLSEAHSVRLSTLAIGVVLAASGAGGALGFICSRFIPDKVRRVWLPIQLVVWSAALAFLAIAGAVAALPSAITMLILGLTGAIGNIEYGTYLVSRVADDMIAKVTGIGQMLMIGSCALGPVIGGAAFQRYGPEAAVIILLVIAIALAVFSLAMVPRIRQITRGLRQSVSLAGIRPRHASSGSIRLAAFNPVNRADTLATFASGGVESGPGAVVTFVNEGSALLRARQMVDHCRHVTAKP